MIRVVRSLLTITTIVLLGCGDTQPGPSSPLVVRPNSNAPRKVQCSGNCSQERDKLAVQATEKAQTTETPESVPPAELSAALEDDIREAVFKYQLRRGRSGRDADNRKLRGPCCLSIGNNELPSASLMKRFQGYTPPIIGVSGRKPAGGIVADIDPDSDEPHPTAHNEPSKAAVQSENEFGGWVDAINEFGQPGTARHYRKGKEKGITLFIERIEWLNDSEVMVTGGWYAGPMASEGTKFHVIRKDGVWKVQNTQFLWIS